MRLNLRVSVSQVSTWITVKNADAPGQLGHISFFIIRGSCKTRCGKGPSPLLHRVWFYNYPICFCSRILSQKDIAPRVVGTELRSGGAERLGSVVRGDERVDGAERGGHGIRVTVAARFRHPDLSYSRHHVVHFTNAPLSPQPFSGGSAAGRRSPVLVAARTRRAAQWIPT